MLQYLRRRPKRPRLAPGRTDPIDAFVREQLLPGKSESRMSSASQDYFEPSASPEADRISSKAHGASGCRYNPRPRCMICWDLNTAVFPMHIRLTRLRTLLQSCCPACNMLHSVLQPWRKRIEKIGFFHIYFDDSTVGITVYPSTFVGNVSQVRLFAIDDCPLPWPAVAKRPRIWGIENAAEARLRISEWLHTCTASHTCGDNAGSTFLPKRVLEIEGHHKVRLRLTNEHEEGIYLCLSHRWGGVVPLRLTLSTINPFQEAIQWPDLPRTFQEAIDLTLELRFRFIWIDSLCILQDDLNDWRQEGGKMAAIYSGAYLTLAATGSPNSNGGLYRCMLPYDSNGNLESYSENGHCESLPSVCEFSGSERGASYCISVMPSSLFRTKRLPLQQRAWFFQEWILSNRIVHFTDNMLYWECASEGKGEDASPADAGLEVGRRSTYLSFGRKVPSELMSLSSLDRQMIIWHGIVYSYSGLQLSYPSDMLPALQGVATRVAAERQSRYHAGLWEDTIIPDLLWRTIEPSSPGTWKGDSQAPSWSWASSRYVFYQDWGWFRGADYQSAFLPEVSVISVSTQPVEGNFFGQVSGGSLVLKGLCLPAVQVKHNLIPLTSRNELDEDIRIFAQYRSLQKPAINEWNPDYDVVLEPGSDLMLILVGSWPRERTAWFEEKAVYESWFLAFQCVDSVHNTYRRVGLVWTERLAYRARFLRHAIEQELTII